MVENTEVSESHQLVWPTFRSQLHLGHSTVWVWRGGFRYTAKSLISITFSLAFAETVEISWLNCGFVTSQIHQNFLFIKVQTWLTIDFQSVQIVVMHRCLLFLCPFAQTQIKLREDHKKHLILMSTVKYVMDNHDYVIIACTEHTQKRLKLYVFCLYFQFMQRGLDSQTKKQLEEEEKKIISEEHWYLDLPDLKEKE